jgi:hypothetical protein
VFFDGQTWREVKSNLHKFCYHQIVNLASSFRSIAMTSRREFFVNLTLIGTALAGGQVFAQATLAESDPQATALGYKADTTKVDAGKFPKHDKAQACKNCALFQAKPTDAAGGCPLFAGKQVSANGWCSAYNKKA